MANRNMAILETPFPPFSPVANHFTLPQLANKYPKHVCNPPHNPRSRQDRSILRVRPKNSRGTFPLPHPPSTVRLTFPVPKKNFLALCASGYYGSSPFHRLIPSFMAQTGAPAHPSPPENPKGGRSIWGGAFEDEIRPALRHSARGVVSMANKGPGTNGSQFFILFDKAPHLDGLNTVFGKVIGDDSLETLAKIEGLEVDKKNRPKEKVVIERVTVHANPLAG